MSSAEAVWTAKENDLLRDAVRRYGVRRWDRVSLEVPCRSEFSCCSHWNELQDGGTTHIRRQWASDEDKLLSTLVSRHGASQWAIISSFLPGRSGKQCRERWRNQLHPSIKRSEWSVQEDSVLFTMHQQLGNAWSRIAEDLPGRTDNAVKNRWHSVGLKQRAREQRWKLAASDIEQIEDDLTSKSATEVQSLAQGGRESEPMSSLTLSEKEAMTTLLDTVNPHFDDTDIPELSVEINADMNCDLGLDFAN